MCSQICGLVGHTFKTVHRLRVSRDTYYWNNYTDNDLSHLSIKFNIYKNNNRLFTVLIKYIYTTIYLTYIGKHKPTTTTTKPYWEKKINKKKKYPLETNWTWINFDIYTHITSINNS